MSQLLKFLSWSRVVASTNNTKTYSIPNSPQPSFLTLPKVHEMSVNKSGDSDSTILKHDGFKYNPKIRSPYSTKDSYFGNTIVRYEIVDKKVIN